MCFIANNILRKKYVSLPDEINFKIFNTVRTR